MLSVKGPTVGGKSVLERSQHRRDRSSRAVEKIGKKKVNAESEVYC